MTFLASSTVALTTITIKPLYCKPVEGFSRSPCNVAHEFATIGEFLPDRSIQYPVSALLFGSTGIIVKVLILSVETSGMQASIALLRDGQCLEERFLSKQGRRHAQTLVAEVHDLLRSFKVKPTDCQAVAVSLGPGSFTGLRVGVVFAKTFAYATGCQLVAVDTFQSIAENSPPDRTEVHVIADAQRHQLYANRFCRNADGRFEPMGSIVISEIDEFCCNRQKTDIVTGPGIDLCEPQLSDACCVLASEFRQSRALVVAELGERRLRKGEIVDPWNLEPAYHRRSAAEENRAAQNSQGSTRGPKC